MTTPEQIDHVAAHALDHGSTPISARTAAHAKTLIGQAQRAENERLRAQWAAVPWEQLWRLYNGDANDETFQTVFAWLLANTPDEVIE